jgi:hypothetical protein
MRPVFPRQEGRERSRDEAVDYAFGQSVLRICHRNS